MINSFDSIRDAKPLVVCGQARSGTRYVTNVLNRHESVAVVGETPETPLRDYLESAKRINGYYDNLPSHKREWGALWKQQRQCLLYLHWISLSKKIGKPVSRKINSSVGLKYFGVKTPYHENLWRAYADLSFTHAFRYIFCTRDFEGHFKSMKAKNPRNTIDIVARKYIQSQLTYLSIKEQAPDNISLLRVEDFKEADADRLNHKIFDFLGLQGLPPEAYTTSGTNSSTSHGLVKQDLTTPERDTLARNPVLLRAYQVVSDVENGDLDPGKALAELNDAKSKALT